MRVKAVVTVALCQLAWGCNIYGPELLPEEAAEPTSTGGRGGTPPLAPASMAGSSTAPRPAAGGSPATDAGVAGSSPRDAGPQGGTANQPDAAPQTDGGTFLGGAGGMAAQGGAGGMAAQGGAGGMAAQGGAGGMAAQGGAGGMAAQGGAGGMAAQGGAGGMAAQGGAGGGGGNPPIEPANPALIDDFEDGNLFIFQHEGRQGSWFTDSNPMEPAASLVPTLTNQAMTLDEPRNGNHYGLHMVASGYTLVGTWALFGTHLNLTALGQPEPYPQAAEYSGVRFWAKYGSPPANPLPAPQIGLQLRTTDTTRVAGLPATETGDDDHYGANVTLTAQWTQHSVRWTDMRQGGWGKPQPLNPQRGTSIQFNLATPAQGYDIWLDELEFFKASE